MAAVVSFSACLKTLQFAYYMHVQT